MAARQGPLTWNVAIVDANGNPTPEFMRKWVEQVSINGTIPTTAAAVSALLDLIGKTRGALLERGASAWGIISPGANGTVLRSNGAGADPIWDTISDVLDTVSSTRGSIIYRGAGGWVALAPGTAGQALETAGAGADPGWATLPAVIAASSFWIDASGNYYVCAVDGEGKVVTDPVTGDGIYVKNPVFNLAAGSLALTSAHLLVGNASDIATDVALSGDATLANTGAITVTKTSGVAFGYFATGTDAANLTGTVASARIAGSYAGITAVGTITAGVWNGTLVDVAHGGTGAATLTNHGVLVGAGTSAITQLAAGTDNQVLRGATGADPAFGALVSADIPDLSTLYLPLATGGTVAGPITLPGTSGSPPIINELYVPTAFAAGGITINSLVASAPGDAGGTTNATLLQLSNFVSGANNANTLTAGQCDTRNTGTGTLTTANGFQGVVRCTGGGTITSAFAIGCQLLTSTVGSSITTGTNIRVSSPSSAVGGIATAYGLHIFAQKAAGVTTAWAVASDGASDNSYFAGALSVGQTSTPAIALDVSGAIGPKSYTIATLPSVSAKAGQFVYCSDLGGGGALLYSNGSTWQRFGINSYETQSTATGAKTINVLTNANYQNFTATLTGNVTLTLGTTNAYQGATFLIRNKGVGAFTFAIVNGGAGGGTLKTFASATATDALCVFDGTNWVLMQDSAI